MKRDDLPATYVDGYHELDAVRRMRYRALGGTTNLEVSILSFGASSLGSVFHDTDHAESIQVVRHAVKSGINLDTAPWYGHGKSETVLGEALKGIPREAYYLFTKCGRYLPDVMETFDFRAERVITSVEESLARLGVSYIDCLQIHDPEFAPDLDIIIQETLPALQKLKEAGKIKMIGMTGYPLEMQKYVIDHSPVKIDTSLVYCHYSMNDYTLEKWLPYFQDKKIGLINASPISMGLLSDRGPPSWHPATTLIKETCSAAAKYCASQGVDISKLAMHFTLANEHIPTTLVSTASLDRLQANIDAVNERLSETEQAVLSHVMLHYFRGLEGQETWQGVEVTKYWQEIGKALLKKTLYKK